MKIVYIASAIEVDGTSGGATHVSEVARGLRELGHQVLVMARRTTTRAHKSTLPLDITVRTSRWRKELAILNYPKVRGVVAKTRPDVIMERFYNFAGPGVLAAHRSRIPVLLEVNAPMIDPPGSKKSNIDKLMLGSMRRWAVKQAQWSDAIVTPLATTVPPEVPRDKIHELPWGANVERFDPRIRESHKNELDELAKELCLVRRGPVAVFLGSFRSWHGADHFAEAARVLISRGSNMSFLAVGGGPELEPLKQKVTGWGLPSGRFVFAGAQPHERVPNYLALGDIGVAPFDLEAHAPLKEFGFYWSPLKVFEYMAMAIPVVTIDVPPLNRIVRDGEEGLLYAAGDIYGLAGALSLLESEADLRSFIGIAARERVVEHYSWQAHCAALDGILKKIVHAE